jgi:hypothetical protein
MQDATSRLLVCEDCSTTGDGEAGWVLVWLDKQHQPPAMLVYCPGCARQFDAYPDEIFSRAPGSVRTPD